MEGWLSKYNLAQENNVKNGGIIPKAKDGWLGKYEPPTVIQDIVDNLDYSRFTPEAIELRKHGYPEGFPRRVEDIRISPIDNRPQLNQGIYETPEAIAVEEQQQRIKDLHNQFSDFGTRALTLGTFLSQPTEEQLQKGRGDWSDRLPMIANNAAIALAFETGPSAIATVAKAPFQAYKGIMNAANKGEIYKYNPFASGIKENMAYRPVTASRAQKLLQGEPMLQYNPIQNTKSYMPVLDEAGNVTHYNIATNKELFQKYSANQPVTLNINKRNGPAIKAESTLADVLDKINRGKFAGNWMEIGNNRIITLPSKANLAKNVGKDYTESITNQLMSVKGSYPKVGTDVKFTWGKVPKNQQIKIPGKKGVSPPNTINRPLFLEADPTKISMVGAPTKGEFSKYIPKDAGNFPLGKTVIPEKTIIGNELLFPNKGLRMLKLDPVRGYVPISESESATLFKTGAFKPDDSPLIKGIQSIDKGVGAIKDVATGSFKWMDNKAREQQILSEQFEAQIYPLTHDISNLEWKVQSKIRDYSQHIPTAKHPDSWKIGNLQNLSKSFKSSGNEIIADEVGGLGKATNTGTQTITNFKTGEKVKATVKVPGASIKYNIEKGVDKKSTLNKNIESSSDIVVDDTYKQTLESNIKHIEEIVPGAKVFGSSKGVTEGGLPHLTHDYDVFISQRNYDRNVKGKLDFMGDMGPAKQHTLDKKLGQEGVIDFNIIQESSSGYATGERANQIFKQFHPDEYFRASRKAYETGKPIEIPHTPDELLSNMDASVKTVIDAYESVKPKHINKIDAYISYGKPEVVIQAQEKYLKSLVGSRGTLGHQFLPEQFTNEEINKKLLNEIDFIGDVNSVAKNPERMQIALNDFYINNTVLSRGVNANDLKTAEQALKVWDPSYQGGQAMGSGMNHVMVGESGHGNMYGNKQLGLNWNIASPLKYVDDIKRQTDGNYLFSPEEKIEVGKILEKYGVKRYVKNPGELIQNTAYDPNAKAILSEVADKTRRVSTAYGTYGNSIYSSTLRDFDEALDALEFSIKRDVTVPKSYKLRKENLAQNTPSSIRDVKTFHTIKNLLEGGIKKAEERQAIVNEYKNRYEKIINEKIEKAVDKNPLIQEKKRILSKLEADRISTYDKARELRSRMYRLENIRQMTLVFTPVGGLVAGTVAGVRTSMKNDKEDWFKSTTGTFYNQADDKLKSVYEEYMDYQEKFYDDQHDKIKQQRKERKKGNKVSIRYEQPISWYDFTVDKLPQKDNSDLLRIKKNGGTVKNSFQLTNFTTKKQPTWLDKY